MWAISFIFIEFYSIVAVAKVLHFRQSKSKRTVKFRFSWTTHLCHMTSTEMKLVSNELQKCGLATEKYKIFDLTFFGKSLDHFIVFRWNSICQKMRKSIAIIHGKKHVSIEKRKEKKKYENYMMLFRRVTCRTWLNDKSLMCVKTTAMYTCYLLQVCAVQRHTQTLSKHAYSDEKKKNNYRFSGANRVDVSWIHRKRYKKKILNYM